MTSAVFAAFADRPAAEAAADSLAAAGIPKDRVRLHDGPPDANNEGSLELDELITGGFVGNLADLFNGLLNTRPAEGSAATYDKEAQRKGAIVSVTVDSDESAAQVGRLLETAGARGVSTLPQPGLED